MQDWIKIVFTITVVIILLLPAILGYIFGFKIDTFADFAIGIYGIYSLLYFIFQIICSELDFKRLDDDIKSRDASDPNWNEYDVGLVVVGYKEDPLLLKRCLQSIKSNNYNRIKRIIFVVDGNEEGDQYMADIYTEVFNTNVVKINRVLSEIETIVYSIFGNENVCIMQPHSGKREGLYTGFKILMNDPDIKVVVTTDSDTILDENAIKELAYQCHHDEVGAVAGQIAIWNTSESLLTHIVSYRYWLSFNLERACESFWKTVLCVAGPMACYKMEVLKEIMDEWYNQKFLGQRCTFGDDRHLTNRVLLKGKKVVYTKYALGYTDTPSDWSVYLKQQTRWSKSYFREFLFNLQSIHLHPIWMCYELCYNIFYFFLLMYVSIFMLYFASIYQQALALLVTVAVGSLKSIYGVIKSGKFGFLYFYLYSFVYYFVIIPSKLSALVTLWDMQWGTRGKHTNWFYSYWSVIVWIGTLAGGFGYTISKNLEFNFDNYKYKVAFISFMVFIGLILITIISELILRKLKCFSNEHEKDIKKERKNLVESF